MESAGPSRQSLGDRPVAAFDFDGTITVRDSFMDFLRWRAGPIGYALGLIRLAPDVLAYLGHRDRGRLKAAAVRVFLRGTPREALESACRAYSAQAWPRLIRPDAEQRWRDLRAQGAYLVIVTASPETVVAPFANRLGADLLIGTRLGFSSDGRVTGAFVTPNCRGEEKVCRLKEMLGDDLSLAAAFGDTSGDREMLALASEAGFRVFTARP